jgi:TonB family protein
MSGVPVLTSAVPESLVVLTQDAELLATLRRVASGRSISIVAAEADLAVHLLSDHGAVALIDTASLASPVAQLTERLKSQFPEVVLVIAGGAQDQSALTAQIGSGTVYRFLHKPLSEQRVRLFVEAAWRRHGEEHAGIVGLAQMQTAPALERKRSFAGAWICVALAAGVAAAYFLATRESKPPAPTQQIVVQEPAVQIAPNPAPLPAATSEAVTAEPIVETPPPAPTPPAEAVGKPEASSVPAALEVDDKQRQLIERLMSEARNAFAANHSDEGQRWMQAAREAGATDDDLDWLSREGERVRLALQAQNITQLAQQFNDRLNQGKLVQPANDSARFYLTQLKQVGGDHPATRLAEEALATRLLAEARSFVAKQDFAAARRWLVEARDAGADATRITAVESEITVAQVVPPPLAESSLHKIRHVDPEYPADARASGAGGWVDLDLIVEADGTVSEIAVVGAQPKGLFEKAAVSAARKWRYEPAAAGVQRPAQHTRVRIRFELK